jgi:hypothetical protein
MRVGIFIFLTPADKECLFFGFDFFALFSTLIFGGIYVGRFLFDFVFQLISKHSIKIFVFLVYALTVVYRRHPLPRTL